jgi:hypothetical protein
VDYLILKRGHTKHQALVQAGWKPKDGSEPQFLLPKNVLTGDAYLRHLAPPLVWQAQAKVFVEYCTSVLWGDKGQQALDYLRGRGLTDEIIKMAQIGYNPARLRQSAEKWGRKEHGFLAAGITIPWFVGEGELWRVTIRDEKIADGEGRYKQIAGSSNGLYLSFTLSYDRPVVLVEGEIDALSIAQECGHDVSVCATGGTIGSHSARCLGALAGKDLVLIAFDAEERGDKASDWWLNRLENAQRLRPFWKDANQMLQEGVDLLEDWILPRLESILYGPSPIPTPESSDVCKGCGCPFPSFEGWEPENIPMDDVMNFDPEDGEMYCEKCRPGLFEQVCELAQAS